MFIIVNTILGLTERAYCWILRSKVCKLFSERYLLGFQQSKAFSNLTELRQPCDCKVYYILLIHYTCDFFFFKFNLFNFSQPYIISYGYIKMSYDIIQVGLGQVGIRILLKTESLGRYNKESEFFMQERERESYLQLLIVMITNYNWRISL